jgi:hypothetical protein
MNHSFFFLTKTYAFPEARSRSILFRTKSESHEDLCTYLRNFPLIDPRSALRIVKSSSKVDCVESGSGFQVEVIEEILSISDRISLLGFRVTEFVFLFLAGSVLLKFARAR